MRPIRWFILLLLSLVPLITLIHRNDLRHWDRNREAMVAPDEFSYLLMADSLLHGHGFSTQQEIGRDTFYPPGFPALLALWGLLAGWNILTAHTLCALLLCLAAPVVYVIAKNLLARLAAGAHPRFTQSPDTRAWLALLITALFVTNWNVLESALFIFSEPAFMLTLFAWLSLALAWPTWHLSLPKTLAITLLALAAWSIRGAGITCIAATFLFPLIRFLHALLTGSRGTPLLHRLAPLLLILALAGAYQLLLTRISPEKSLAAASSSSYPAQLSHGLTDAGRINPHDPHQWPHLVATTLSLALSHLDDYSAAFTPWFRESPGLLLLNIIGKTMGALGLLGWFYHALFVRSAPITRMLELFLLLYIALYLLWPFNFARFWIPILPLMLVYGVDALREFWSLRTHITPARAAVLLLTLLLALSIEELYVQLGNYERRLNYVSDSIAAAAATVVLLTPDPHQATIEVTGESELFTYAWYLPRTPGYIPTAPLPQSPSSPAKPETIEQMLLRSIADLHRDPTRRLFLLSYFNGDLLREVFANLQRQSPEIMHHIEIRPLFQKEIISAVWELRLRENTLPATSTPINH